MDRSDLRLYRQAGIAQGVDARQVEVIHGASVV
jgi:hypothetical protein